MQRGNVSLYNLQVLNAFSACDGTGLQMARAAERFGSWHTIDLRMNRLPRFVGSLSKIHQQRKAVRKGPKSSSNARPCDAVTEHDPGGSAKVDRRLPGVPMLRADH